MTIVEVALSGQPGKMGRADRGQGSGTPLWPTSAGEIEVEVTFAAAARTPVLRPLSRQMPPNRTGNRCGRFQAKELSPASPTTGQDPGCEGSVATRVLSLARAEPSIPGSLS